MHRMVVLLVFTSLLASPSVAEAPPPEHQIAAAVQAAPEGRRDGAAVIGWNAEGKAVTLREGSNELVCLAATPGAQRWSVACYHKDLEPFMARGRELTAQGVSGSERGSIRYKEVEEGKLAMPREPRTLYVLHGEGFDPESGTVTKPFLRWVIYYPFATAEATGLPTAPTPGGPWLMEAGTAGAHIMITPPR